MCRTSTPPAWLQRPGKGPWGLRRLRRPMIHMEQALQDIIRHQRDLHHPEAEILRRLNRTHWKVRALLSNLAGLFPTPSPRPGRRPLPSPAASLGVFRQKLQGCQILWSYARFMAERSAELSAGSRRTRRDKGKGKGTSARGSGRLARP